MAMTRFIALHADEVGAVADALLETESLTGDEVDQVMARARGETEAGEVPTDGQSEEELEPAKGMAVPLPVPQPDTVMVDSSAPPESLRSEE